VLLNVVLREAMFFDFREVVDDSGAAFMLGLEGSAAARVKYFLGIH